MTQIASIQKNKRETLIVELSEYKGHNLVSLRVWANNSEGVAVPTPKGVTVSVALLPAIREAFQTAESEARRLGLMNEVQA